MTYSDKKPSNMNVFNILRTLTTLNNDNENLEITLEYIVKDVSALLINSKPPIDEKYDAFNDFSTRRKYLETLLHVLQTLQTEILSKSDTFMSVSEYRSVKEAIQIAISIGIVPCLIPGLAEGVSILPNCKTNLKEAPMSDLAKYSRLKTTTNVLLNCYNEISLRPTILTVLEPLLAALFQLAYAPLLKPAEAAAKGVKISQELYNDLQQDHHDFSLLLNTFVKNSPQSEVMKALMYLLGLKNAPKWLPRRVRSCLVTLIIEPTGVMALVNAICEDSMDIGQHWDRLETTSRLIATPHTQSEVYYDAICPQVIEILRSKTLKNAAIIANACIKAIYDTNLAVCKGKIINIITTPLKRQSTSTSGKKTESEVSEALEDLSKCFVHQDAKFKQLPCTLIADLAVPLFSIHSKVHKSALLLKNKVRELLLSFLEDEDMREKLFARFLGHTTVSEYGEWLNLQFGQSGGLEVIENIEENFDEYSTDVADALYALVEHDNMLSLSLLNYLLRWLTERTLHAPENPHLECEEDVLATKYQQLTAQKLLMSLAAMKPVQKDLLKQPESLLAFVKSLFVGDFTDHCDSEDFESPYAGLMLVRLMLSEDERPSDWRVFDDFATFLREKMNATKFSSLACLIWEILEVIRAKGRSRRYQDLSSDAKDRGKFEQALEDLANSLLPVRAHGLMTLTKLIESEDPEALARRDFVLYFFQQNLRDEDSFVYLTAINGLCAMASKFPEEVIEILVQEFIDMPGRSDYREIEPENRAKLGEILVKTTRALGDMAPKYKNVLVNGFLCAVRDPDSMVRASSLSCLGELCKILGFRLGNVVIEVLYCLGCILETDKALECRRAAVLVINLLIQGLGRDVLSSVDRELVQVYRRLKFLRDNDDDDVLRLHAQLALEELDDIVQKFLFSKPVLQKNISLLH